MYGAEAGQVKKNSVPQMHGEMKDKSPGAPYNRVRLINGMLWCIYVKRHRNPMNDNEYPFS